MKNNKVFFSAFVNEWNRFQAKAITITSLSLLLKMMFYFLFTLSWLTLTNTFPFQPDLFPYSTMRLWFFLFSSILLFHSYALIQVIHLFVLFFALIFLRYRCSIVASWNNTPSSQIKMPHKLHKHTKGLWINVIKRTSLSTAGLKHTMNIIA